MNSLELEARQLMHDAVPVFEDALGYPREALCELWLLGRALQSKLNEIGDNWTEENISDVTGKVHRYKEIVSTLSEDPSAPKRIYLWPEGKMPQNAEYTENTRFYNHDPEFRPYMLEILQPADMTPKGAIVMCAGGDHGDCVFQEIYGILDEWMPLGYQIFILLNRVNMNPWQRQDVGADAARAIRIIRKDAAKYRIDPDKVAFMGFSNGGLTGENCIEYYSGTQTVKDSYPDYEPDELDAYKGSPDAFVCVYGPRFVNAPFKWEGVEYPPVFFAIGREDKALDNFNYVYPQLLERNIPVEIHTFGGVPHGQSGMKMLGETRYQNFHLWIPLADAFLMDTFGLN